MSLTLEVLRERPRLFCMMDGPSPFTDYSGYGRTATLTGTRSTHAPLVYGASSSTVLHKAATASFDTPAFTQGTEASEFSLEAFVRPINKSEGWNAQPYQENLATNPSLETGTTSWAPRWFGNGGAGTSARTNAVSFAGSWYYRKTWTTAPISSLDTGYTYSHSGVVAGKTYSFSMAMRSNRAQPWTRWVEWYDAGNVKISNSPSINDTTANPANVWKAVKLENVVAPAGAVRADFCVGAYNGPIVAWAVGDTCDADGVVINEGPTVNNYFDGAMPGYEWVGTTHASVSRTRTDVAVTNLMYNPSMAGPLNSSSRLRSNIAWSDSSTTAISGSTLTTGVVADGVTWTRLTSNATGGSGTNIARKYVNLSSLVNAQTYTASWEVYNDTAASVTVTLDWCDTGSTTYTILPGQRRVIFVTSSKAVYDATYRFADFSLETPSTSILFREVMVENATAYNPYFDGSTTMATFNQAKGAAVALYSSTGTLVSSLGKFHLITNGSAPTGGNNTNSYYDSGTSGLLQAIQVDLGSVKTIDTIKTWHYFTDARTYHATKVQVSADGTNWTTVFDSAVSGEYAESATGKIITFANQKVRYIRDWLNGNSINTNNHWVEIQAYDTTNNFEFAWAGASFAAEAFFRGKQYGQWANNTSIPSGTAVAMTEGSDRFNRFMYSGNTPAAAWRLVLGSMSANNMNPGDTVTVVYRVRVGGGWDSGLTCGPPQIINGGAQNGAGASFGNGANILYTNQWQTITKTMVVVTKPGNDAGLYIPLQPAALTEDSWFDVDYAHVFVGTDTAIFDGDSMGAGWTGTQYASSSYMIPSNMEQQILGNLNQMDGLTWNGTKISFVTKYLATGECRATYDIQELRSIMVRGVHTDTRNQLMIDGQVVSESIITDAQSKDKFVATDSKLYSGATAGSNRLAINGVSIYTTALDQPTAKRHFDMARYVVPETDVPVLYDGQRIPLSYDPRDIFLEQTYTTAADWAKGGKMNVVVQDDRLQPEMQLGVSRAGTWTGIFPITGNDLTSIYGVNMNWDAEGATIQASLDGTTWVDVQRGANVSLITPGFNPTTAKTLQFKITFPGGIVNDTSYLDNLTITGLITGIVPAVHGRTVTMTAPAYVRKGYPVPQLHDNWGVELKGGSVVISASQEETPGSVATLELWIKANTNTPQISVTNTATVYKSGVATTWGEAATPVGEWSLIHLVYGTPVTGAITITGDCEIAQAVIYETQLTTAQMQAIEGMYFGRPVLRVGDNSAITVTEPVTAATLYARDWSISSAM